MRAPAAGWATPMLAPHVAVFDDIAADTPLRSVTTPAGFPSPRSRAVKGQNPGVDAGRRATACSIRADVDPDSARRLVRMRIALRGSSGVSRRLGCVDQKMTSDSRTAPQAASRRLPTDLSSNHPQALWMNGGLVGRSGSVKPDCTPGRFGCRLHAGPAHRNDEARARVRHRVLAPAGERGNNHHALRGASQRGACYSSATLSSGDPVRLGQPRRDATDARGSIASGGARGSDSRTPSMSSGSKCQRLRQPRRTRIGHAIAGTPKTRHCTDPCAGQARKQPPAPRLTRKSPRFPRADTAPFHTLIHTLTHSPSTPHVDSAPARRIRVRRQAFSRCTALRSPPRRGSWRSATAPGPCARRHSGDAMISTRRANANAHLDCLSTALWTVDPHLLWMTGAERAASRESCLRSLQPGFELRTTTPGTGPGVSVERSRGLRTSCGPRSPSRRR